MAILSKKDTLVASFNSTHAALAFEKQAKAANIEGRLIPTPPQIKADCGLAFKTELKNREALEQLIGERKLEAELQIVMLMTC